METIYIDLAYEGAGGSSSRKVFEYLKAGIMCTVMHGSMTSFGTKLYGKPFFTVELTSGYDQLIRLHIPESPEYEFLQSKAFKDQTWDDKHAELIAMVLKHLSSIDFCDLLHRVFVAGKKTGEQEFKFKLHDLLEV